jgi:hypothetical protein
MFRNILGIGGTLNCEPRTSLAEDHKGFNPEGVYAGVNYNKRS